MCSFTKFKEPQFDHRIYSVLFDVVQYMGGWGKIDSKCDPETAKECEVEDEINNVSVKVKRDVTVDTRTYARTHVRVRSG